VCVAFWVSADVPSPKVQWKDTAPVQFEIVADAVKVTERGAWPEDGEADVEHSIVHGGSTEIVPVFEQVTPWTVAVRVQLKVPAAA
jgi:hypothetical protein